MSGFPFPLVTIGIPTYNRANGYLRETLESALAQTYPNIEIVVSNNGSTDDTENVVKSYNDPRIRYFKQQPPLIPNDNFNFCVEQARGDYFLLLHDDDSIDPDFVEICMQTAKHSNTVGIIRTGTRRIDANGKVLKEEPNLASRLSTRDFFLSWLNSECDLYLCSTLFSTQRLKEIGGFRSKHNLFQDVLAELRLAAKFGRVDVQDVKASFRRHFSQRTAASTISKWCEDSLFLLDHLCALIPDEDAAFRAAGNRKFARHNYNFAMGIRSPLQRYLAYFVVYKAFNYQYSPPLLGRLRGKLAMLARVLRLSGA